MVEFVFLEPLYIIYIHTYIFYFEGGFFLFQSSKLSYNARSVFQIISPTHSHILRRLKIFLYRSSPVETRVEWSVLLYICVSGEFFQMVQTLSRNYRASEITTMVFIINVVVVIVRKSLTQGNGKKKNDGSKSKLAGMFEKLTG